MDNKHGQDDMPTHLATGFSMHIHCDPKVLHPFNSYKYFGANSSGCTTPSRVHFSGHSCTMHMLPRSWRLWTLLS